MLQGPEPDDLGVVQEAVEDGTGGSKVSQSTEACRADRVWNFLVDPEKIPEWCIPAKKLRHTGEQRSGVGTPFYFEEKAGGRLMKLDLEVTEWVVNERVAFKMTSGNFVKGYEQKYVIEAAPPDTRFTFTENIELPYGILGKVAGLFARFGSEARVKATLFKLKSMAEA